MIAGSGLWRMPARTGVWSRVACVRACSSVKADMNLVRTLRATTSFGIVDCRDALLQAGNDLGGARRLLRDWARAKAAKKLDRVATEGLLTIAADATGERAAVVEVNSETDFVPRLLLFQRLCDALSQLALARAEPRGEAEIVTLDVAALLDASVANPFDADGALDPVRDAVLDVIGQVGENVQLRRVALLHNPGGVIVPFVHGCEEAFDHMGTLVGLVGVRAVNGAPLSPDARNRVRAELEPLARHVATAPRTVTPFYAGAVNEQFYGDEVYLTDDARASVGSFVADLGARAAVPGGLGVNLWQRWRIGEGLKKKDQNFAKEVADQVEKAASRSGGKRK